MKKILVIDDEEMIVDAFLQRSRRLSAGEIVSES